MSNYSSIQQYAQLVELKDYRAATKKEYLRGIRKLAEHFQCDPATLTENQVREYFLFLRQEKKFGRSAMTIAKAALCCKVQDWPVFNELRIACPKVLPVVLSREEVAKVLAVQVNDLHGRENPPRLHVRNASFGTGKRRPSSRQIPCRHHSARSANSR